VLIAKVQASGQVTIPPIILQRCGIEAEDDLYFESQADGSFRCYKLPRPRTFRDIIDFYTVDAASPDPSSLRDAMAEDMTYDVQGDASLHVRE
jgi:bifunctional DNA-binding transcriptional regulator/antitoxin component of YhaV-PrlF toxin-antitoxin module